MEAAIRPIGTINVTTCLTRRRGGRRTVTEWVVDSQGHKETCTRCWPGSPCGKGILLSSYPDLPAVDILDVIPEV